MGDFVFGPHFTPNQGGQIFRGSCNDDMTGSATAIHIRELRGFSEDLLNSRYYMQVIKNYNAIAAAPIGETRQITNYISDTGVFTTAAFTANVEANDIVLVIHESIALFALHADADHSRVVNDSWLAQILAVTGTIADYDDSTMSLEALNIDLDALIADIPSISNAQTWNATALTAIETQCTGAIELDNLDHLSKAVVDTNLETTNADNSTMGYLFAKANVTNYDRTAHSLEAIGDAVDAAIIEAECLDALEGIGLDHLITILLPAALDALVVDNSLLGYILTSADVTNYDRTTMSLQALNVDLDALITAIALIPQSGGVVSWNATALTAIQGEVTNAIEADELHYLMALATSDIVEPVNMSPEIANNSVLANVLDDGGVTANYDRRYHALNAIAAGTTRIAVTTEELAAAAGDKDLFTGTTTDVILESLSLRNAAVDCSDDAGGFTGISIQTDDATPATIIAQADGVKANLTSEAQLGWIGTLVIKTDTKIQLTIYGAAADAACAPDIIAKFRSTGSGNGTLVA